jgi:tetratricopeptide (TPR) repeat protein/predicted Ser/Thr protein kinase
VLPGGIESLSLIVIEVGRSETMGVFAPGSKIDRYRAEEKVGSGGFGDVYRATDPVLNRTVAIKVIRASGNEEANRVNDALGEARSASALNHPSIVTIYDVDEHHGEAFIVMEWVDGKTLREVLTGNPAPPHLVAVFGKQIASALLRAHEVGIVHRDLKPENIMVRTDDLVKILDFGLALHRPTVNTSCQETAMLEIAGTLSYMAPEQLEGNNADASSDLFALGVILYELVTGRHPFAADTPFAVSRRILHAEPEAPGTLVNLPTGWNELILQLLTKDRHTRVVAKADMLPVLELAGRTADAGLIVKAEQKQRAARMVGRAAEVAEIDRLWSEATSGSGTFVMVTGEAGTGKTTLVQNVLGSFAEAGRTIVAAGRCSERLGAGEPYLPFLDALTELCGSRHGALLRAILKKKAPTWFIQLFPASSGDSSLQGRFASELVGGSQERMRRELGDALEEVGRSYAICILLEDLHWSDLATCELIAYLSKRISKLPLLVLGTYRPADLRRDGHPLRPILLEMEGHRVSREIRLDLLTEMDVAVYLGLEFDDHRFPTEFAVWLHTKTGGTPLFMTDVVRYLVKREAIVLSTHWQLARPIQELEGEVPASVRSMIELKMDVLSEEQRRLLVLASVQGETFDSLTLSEAANIDELRLEEQLEELARLHNLVVPVAETELGEEAMTTRHKFVHVLYQNTLYDALTLKRRMLLHERIATVLERHFGGHGGPAAAELAQHFDRARKPRRALPYYIMAAENAVSKFAHAQGEVYCNRAVELAMRLPEGERDRPLLDILKTLGKILFVMSRLEDSASVFQQALECAERLGEEVGSQIDVLLRQSEALYFSKKNDQLESKVEKILSMAEEHDECGASAPAHFILGMQRLCYGHLDEAERLLKQAGQEAREGQRLPILARTTAWHAEIMFFRSDYDRALRTLRKAESMAFETHDGFLLLMTRFFQGLSLANSGHLADGLHSIERGLDLAEKNYDLLWLGRFPNSRAWIHAEAFDHETALELNREAVVIARETGFLEPEANSRINLGIVATRLGELDLARQSFLDADDLFSRDEWFRWRYRLRLLCGWADLLLKEGDSNGARDKARLGLEAAEKVGARKYSALSSLLLGRIALAEDEIADAERYLTAAVDCTKDLQAPVMAWRTYAALGDLYRLTHRDDEARDNDGAARQLLLLMAEQSSESLGKSILASKETRSLGS